IAQASGHGHARIGATTFTSGQAASLTVQMPRNLASSASGAAVTGNGINLARIVDDDEATNWASLGGPVAGKQGTVDLAGGAQQVQRIKVSAQLRPPIPTDPDSATQNRFTALRQFRVLACTAGAAVDCSDPAQFQVVFTSPADAFPSIAPRPRAPDLTIRAFDIPDTTATHLRLEGLTSQGTGAPGHAGGQDTAPRAGAGCATPR